MSCTDQHYLRSPPLPCSSSLLVPAGSERFGRSHSQVFPMKPSSESESGSGSQMKGGSWTSHSESGLGSRDDEESASMYLRNLSKLILPPLGVSSDNQTQINATGKIISPMDTRYR